MPPTLYDNDRAGIVSWLVYINGIEVPAQAVSVSYGVWQVPQAAISLVPDSILHRLGAEDRISVQIFYLDQWQYSPPQYCLLFDGEIVGWGQTSTTGARSLQINCHDYIQIFSQLFFFLMSSFDDMAIGASGTSIGISGATINVAGYGALYPFSLFSQGLADPGDGAGSAATIIKRPVDFAYNIVRALIKAQHPNRAVPATNFFAPWCKRTNFHKRWVALPYFDADPLRPDVAGIFPILRAVQDEKAVSAVARMASNTGASGSLWQMLTEVLKTVLMEVVMLPTPAAVRSDYSTLLPKGQPSAEAPVFLTNYFVKPSTFFSLPPACNVFFPSQLETYSYQEGIAEQPTRMYFNESATLALLGNSAGNSTSAGLQGTMQDALCTGYPEEVDIAARDAGDSPGQNGKNLLVYPEEFFKGPVILRQAMPRWFSFLLEAMQSQTTSGTGHQTPSTARDGETNDVQTDSALQFHSTNDATGLLGADDAVPDVRGAELQARAGGPLPVGKQVISAEQRQRLVVSNPSSIGRATPPQVFPVSPASAGRLVGGAGSFFSSRGPERLHAGIDISGARGTVIVCPVDGRITDITRIAGAPHSGRATTNTQGNAVYVRDTAGGTHRFMHLDTVTCSRGPVTAGQSLGTMGNSAGDGTRFGVHLHYDVTSSGGYRLNYTSRLNGLRNGRAGAPAEASAPQNAPPAAPPAGPTNPPAGQPQTGGPALTPTPAAAPAGQSEIAAGDTVRNVFKLYAACQYYTERYQARTGTLTAPFNPYPVPGFGCAVFDRRATALDVFGYLTAVSHQLSTGGWTSQFSFTHGRTFQEMFALMQRSAALEAARLGQNQNAIEIAVRNRDLPADTGNPAQGTTNTLTSTSQVPLDSTGTPVVVAGASPDAVLSGFAVPVGATAMAPAEPIQEIRVLQEFERAESFYQTLLYRDIGLGSDLLSLAQFRESRDTSDDVPSPYLTVQETGAAPRPSELANLAAAAAQSGEQIARERAGARPALAPERLRSTAVFRYSDIVDMETLDGTTIPISIQGVDTTTRTRLLQAIAAIRRQSYTEDDVRLLQEATQTDVRALLPLVEGENQALQASVAAAPLPEAQRQQLQQLLQETEITLRTEGAQINVRGDVHIVPRPGAEALFNSFQAAMQYNARPICTLDEYLLFLGEDGLAEGETHPQASNLYANVDPKPAKYYKRLRRLRPGPPSARPGNNYTNTEAVSDAPAGTPAIASAEDPGALISTEPVPVLVDQAAVEQLVGPLTGFLPRNSGPLVDAMSRMAGATTQETFARFTAQSLALLRTSQSAGGTTDAYRTALLALIEKAVQNTLTDPPATTGTRAVAGVPADFPDTRANWDILLEQYIHNVLQRKPPRM